MTDYKSSIGISIKLDPQNKLKNDLDQLLNKLSETSKVNLDINIKDSNITNQLKNINDLANNLKRNLSGNVAFGNIDKSINQINTQAEKLNGELLKVSRTNLGNGLYKQTEQVATSIGEITKQTGIVQKMGDDFNYVGDTVKTVTSNMGEYNDLLLKVAKAQESLSSLKLVDQNKVNNLSNFLSGNNVGSSNELKNYLNQVKELENEEIRLKQIQKEELDLINQMTNAREKSQLKSQQSDRNKELAQAKAINQALQDNYQASIKEAEAQKQVQQELEKQIRLLEIQKQSLTRQYGNKIDTTDIDNAVSKLKSMNNINMNDLRNEISNIKIGIKEITEQARNSESLFGKLGNSLRNVGIYIDITDVVRGVTNSIRDSIDTVIRMDSALGSLNKVVSMSQSQLQQMRDSAIDMGKELGRSSIEIANAQAEFGRLYKTQNEINNMTKVSVMGANVMDGVSSAEVAKGLTTVISSMKLEAKDSMDILDSMNEIQNNYRVGANDLLNALAKVGSTAYTSGTNLKQVEGYITSIAVSTGKSGDEIGNALKSIMSRVYKLGEEGLESEGKPEKMLNDMGVAVRDASGNFRNFSAILSDLDVKWRNMSNTEKIATAQVVAGVHKYNDFMSLMNNYQMAIDSTNTALNSQGSALKENEIHLQTAEAKLGILKATTEEFYMKLINSDAIKSTIDGLTTLVSTFGNLPTIVGLATSALILFKGEAIAGAISSIYGYITSLVSLASTEGIVATATSELSLVMATNPFGLIAIAIAGVTVGLVSMNKYLEESTNYIDKMNDATKGLQEMKTGENLVKQYNDLNAVINNTSSTTEQVTSAKEKLIGVQKQLASQFPNLVDGYTKEGDALVRNINLVEEKINKDKKMLVAQAESNYGNLINQINDKQMNKFNDTTSDSVWWLPNTWKSDIETYNNLLKESENTEEGLSENRKNKLTELSAKFGDLNKAIITMKDNGQDISGKQMFDFSTGKLVDAKEYLKDIEKQVDNTSKSSKELNNSMEDMGTGGLDNQAKSIAEATEEYSKSTQEIAKMEGYIDKLNKSQSMTTTLAKQISTAYPEIGDGINSVASAQEFLTSKIEDQVTVQQSAIEIMKGDDEEFYQEKIAHNEEFQTAYNDLLNAFVSDGEGAYSVDFDNFSTLNQLKQVTQGDLGIAVENWLRQFVGSSADGYAQDFANFQSFAQAKASILDKLNAKIQSLSSSLQSAQNYASQGLTGSGQNLSLEHMSIEQAQAYEAEIAKLGSAKKEINDLFNDAKIDTSGYVGGGVGGFTPSSGGGSGKSGKSDAEKQAEEAEKWADKINELNSEIKTDQYYEANNAITQLDTTMKSLKTSQDGLTGSELQESKKKEIEVMNQQIEAYKHLEELQGYEKDHIASILSNYGILTDSTGKLTNAYEVLSEAQKKANSMSGNTEDEYNAKKDAIEQVKQLNEYITKYGEIVNNTIPETANKWQELTNEIKKANDEMKKANEEALNSLQEELAQAILKDAQDEVDNLKKQAEQAREDAKQALEDEKEAELALWDEKIKAKQEELDRLDDESNNNEEKLKKLQTELAYLKKDNSTEAQGKIQNINSQISDLQKTIAKDALSKEIDSLNAQKDAESNSYDKQLSDLEKSNKEQETEEKKHYDDMLDEKKAYNKAEKMITKNQQSEMYALLSKYSESYKTMGTSLADSIDASLKKITDGINALNNLKVKDVATSGGSYGDGDSSSNYYEHTSSSGTHYTDIGSGIISDHPLTSDEVGQINSSSSSSKSNTTKTYSNGDYEDSNGYYYSSGSSNTYYDASSGTYKEYATGTDNAQAGYATVAEDGFEILIGKQVKKLKGGETILNNSTSKNLIDVLGMGNGDETSRIDEIYNMIKSTGSILSQQLLMPNGYSIPNILSGVDLNKLGNSITNNTTDNSNSSSIEINNTYQVDATSDFNTKNFSNNLDKQLKNTLRRFGKIK